MTENSKESKINIRLYPLNVCVDSNPYKGACSGYGNKALFYPSHFLTESFWLVEKHRSNFILGGGWFIFCKRRIHRQFGGI